jgi:regulator of protease activity HflC (stomatin/prohibitin superfamily)
MTTIPTRVEVNCETGEVSVIELTSEEISQLEAQNAAHEADRAAVEEADAAKAAAKASAESKLAELGLTAEEIAALTK